MRIAVIADTHLPRGGRRLPRRCAEEIAAADLCLHGGDVATAGALAEIEALGTPLRAVRGNVDGDDLAHLPEELVLEVGGARVALLHDAGPARGRLERLRRRFPDADAVVFGHSHLPLHERAGGFQIFNPGSPTERRRAPRHSMGIAEAAGGAIAFRHLDLS